MNKKILGLGVLSALLLSVSIFSFASADVKSMVESVRGQIVGVAASIVIIGWVIAGILFLTSAGGSRMETAKKAMWAALIGTILVILAAVMYGLINGILQAGGTGAGTPPDYSNCGGTGQAPCP